MTRFRLRYYMRLTLIVLAFAASGGAVYGMMVGGGGGLLNALQGVVTSVAISLPIAMFEIALATAPKMAAFRHAPFALLLLARTAVYLVIIVFGLELGSVAFDNAGDSGLGSGQAFGRNIIVSLGASFAFNFVNQIARMLGRGVLGSFVLGRYHRPRREERVLMMIDMRDSTTIAERIGDLAFHDLLNEFYGHVADAASETGADIHKYVGDEAILAWRPKRAARNGDCLRFFFILRQRIAAAEQRYCGKFGMVPQFRAGLHKGMVVVGEIGVTKQEIAFSGDTMNTAARIEQATRQFDADFLASDAALRGVPLPDGCSVRSVADLQLRGKSERVELFAVSGG